MENSKQPIRTKRRFISWLVKLTELPDNSFKKGTLYVVIAHRWSNSENHSYPVGAYITLSSAINNAHKEVCSRGGKYGCIIYATQHTNRFKEDRLVEIYEIESPYKNKVNTKRSNQ